MVLPGDSSISPRQYPNVKLPDNFGDTDPLIRFKEWYEFAENEGEIEPDACTLSTVSQTGVNARTVALRGITKQGFLIYTNYESDKSREMNSNHNVSLTFYWKKVFRQVRIIGVAHRINDEQNDLYFESRPRGSQVASWISRQSKPLSSRTELEQTYAEFDSQLTNPIERPPFWGGFEIAPTEYEFMQGMQSRLHDRFRFTLNSRGKFSCTRLWP